MDSNAKREAALPPNVSKAIFDQIVGAPGSTASMDPPSVVESGSKEGSAEELSQDELKGGRTTEQRKRVWGAAKKELIGTLKDNGAKLGEQLQASEEGREKRFKASMEFEDRKLNKQLEVEEKRLKHEEVLGNAMQMMAQALAALVQQQANKQ